MSGMEHYLADYHMHCDLSFDSRARMRDMAEAAVAAGLSEVCFTDHVDLYPSGGTAHKTHDFSRRAGVYAETRAAMAGRLVIRQGIELGEPERDPAYAAQLLSALGELDFIIGSHHQLSDKYGWEDLYFCAAHDEHAAREQITDYLEQVRALARWGKFSVLGHLTLPLRYMNENNGLSMSFDGFEAEVAEIFRILIENGCGIECNTNRGHVPLPDGKWLKLYRSLGGEIVTVGTDAHSPDYVGCHVREARELLRECGFSHVCTFEKMQPKFLKI